MAKFRVGDRVRVVTDFDAIFPKGSEYVIVRKLGSAYFRSDRDGDYCLENEIELVEEDRPTTAHHHVIKLDDKEYKFTHKQLRELKLIIEGVLA